LVAIFVVRGPRRLFCVPLFFYPLHILVVAIKQPVANEFDRYLPLDYAFVQLYAAVLLGALITAPPHSWRAPCRIVARLGASAILVLWAVLLLGDHGFRRRSYIVKSQYFYALDYTIGLWLQQNTPPSTRVALYQAGGIRFFSGRPVIDLGAVTDYEKRKYWSDTHGKLRAIVEGGADYVASFGDDWLDKEGVSLRDEKIFTRVPLQCRGLFKVNRPAARAALAALDSKNHS
jgi:hypothetical protein